MELYEVLEVEQSASAEEIKNSYRRLAREYHPDRNPGDEAAETRFKQITAAYEVLSDSKRRQQYDMLGDGQGGQGPGSLFDLGDLLGSVFGDGTIFGGQRRPTGPPPGENLEVHVTLTFEEALFGADKDIKIQTMGSCESCDATGAAAGTSPVRCSACEGKGQVRQVRQSFMGQMVTTSTCHECGGLGETISSPCPDCKGRGRLREDREYSVRIQPGIESGQILQLTGRGAVGERGGAPGNLYIHIEVLPHKGLQREGVHLHDTLHIPMSVAALGKQLKYEMLDGEELLDIKPGTQSGHIIRIRNKGVPHRKSRGDLFVHIHVDVPTDLTPDQQELLMKLAELRDEDISSPNTNIFQKLRAKS